MHNSSTPSTHTTPTVSNSPPNDTVSRIVENNASSSGGNMTVPAHQPPSLDAAPFLPGDAVQNATHGHHGAHTKRDSQRATHCKSGLTDAMQHRETTAGTLKTISTSSPPPRSTPPHPTHTRAHAPSRGVLLPSDMLGFRFSSRTDASTSSGSQYGSSGNMHYPPRGRKNHGQNSRPAPYDKNKFLQANFRFLVSDAIDMSKYRTDADLMLKWDDIVQVEMLTTTDIQCPISLDSPPICPQITPCGHVFTFHAAMQHFLHHGGPQLIKAAPCPLCFQLIAARELRLVNITHVGAVDVGQFITLRLLQRPKNSILVLARDDAECVGQGNGVLSYSKFTTISDPSELWRNTAQQLADLATQAATEGSIDAANEVDTLYRSLDLLERRARAWAERRQGLLLESADPLAAAKLPSVQEAGAVAAAVVAAISKAQPSAPSQEAAVEDFPVLPSRAAQATGRQASQVHITSSSSVLITHATMGHTAEDSSTASHVPTSSRPGSLSNHMPDPLDTRGCSPSTSAPGDAGNDVFFYQAIDGQWVFLHPLNMRMLMHAHKSDPQALPPTLTARIVEREAWVQSEQTRKKLRVLSHIPLAGAFSLCELDLHEHLPEATLQAFAEELKTREDKRVARAAAAARKAATELAREHQEAAARQGPSVEELAAMPALGSIPALRAKGSTELDEQLALGLALMEGGSPPPNTPVSFARITRMGFAATGPALADAYSPSPQSNAAVQAGPAPAASPPKPAGVWGARQQEPGAASGSHTEMGDKKDKRRKKKQPVVLLSSSHRR